MRSVTHTHTHTHVVTSVLIYRLVDVKFHGSAMEI